MPKFLTTSEKKYLYRIANYNGKNRYVKLKDDVYKSNENHLSKFFYYDEKITLKFFDSKKYRDSDEIKNDIRKSKYHKKVMELQKEKNRVLRHSELKNIFDNIKV